MRTTVVKTLFFILAFLSLSSFDQPKAITGDTLIQPFDACKATNNTFQDGEELTYKLFYNWNFIWLSAGEVTFKVTDLGTKYHISAVGSTYPSYEWFFKVRDHYQVFVDKGTLLPQVSIREVHEGGYQLYDKLTFNQKSRKIQSFRGKTKDVAKETSHQVDDCMHDILSAIYYMRSIDYKNLKMDQAIPIKVFMDNESWPLQVKFKGKESRKAIKGQGKFNVLKLSPEVIAGNVFEEGTEMMIYASDDKNKVPLMIESPVSVGSVKAVLKSYKGLKYDMESKN